MIFVRSEFNNTMIVYCLFIFLILFNHFRIIVWFLLVLKFIKTVRSLILRYTLKFKFIFNHLCDIFTQLYSKIMSHITYVLMTYWYQLACKCVNNLKVILYTYKLYYNIYIHINVYSVVVLFLFFKKIIIFLSFNTHITLTVSN